MARDIDGVVKIKFANAGDVSLGGLDLNELWPVAYSTPGGSFPQRAQFNQLFRYLSALAVEINSKGPFLEWDGTAVAGPDYAVGAVVKGSDGNNYTCLIANGPATSIVDPVGDLTGTWEKLTSAYNQVIYTGSGTYAKPAGLTFIIIEVVGGGGGGGGVLGANPGIAAAGGGGAGGYCRKKILASALAASENVTIGAGGAGGGFGDIAGSTGGTSSFGTTPFCSATGGGGGDGGANASLMNIGGNSGQGADGDFNIKGAGGGGGFENGSSFGFSGQGAPSIFGGGGKSLWCTAGQHFGYDGITYGAGGGGGTMRDSTFSASGGDGAGGIVIIHEYF